MNYAPQLLIDSWGVFCFSLILCYFSTERDIALSLVLMVLMLICMSLMHRVDNGEDELGGMMT